MRGAEKRRKELSGLARAAEKRTSDREKRERRKAEQAEKERLRALSRVGAGAPRRYAQGCVQPARLCFVGDA